VPFFVDSKVAMVQARWGHINHDYSLLTKIQSILLDAHFVLEHGGRNRAGLFFNFNGTAGIWRRTAIVDAGGWQHDTLTEDLDLSYRAQSRGWKFVFLPHLVSPAELPVEMNSFKSQQHRWAKGSIQTCRKVLPAILRSNLPTSVKAEAFFHLTANFNYPLMCVLSVLMAPAMVIRYNMGLYEMLLIDVPLFFAATASVANFYMVCQRELHKDWMTRLKYLPFLMSIGIGLAVNNTKAVFEAIFNRQSEFARTPKYRIEGQGDEWIGKKYRQNFVVQPIIELALGLYFTATVFYALGNGIYGTVPFLVLFQVGFLYTGLLSIIQQYAGESVSLDPVTEEE
jgi:cellulose synthase/poly-beta-1,6-N-acetylglucosamine synthase-like glycosyltransferase